MFNEFKEILLVSVFSLVAVCPAYADYWDYYGSGRDHPYSAYIDRANYVGPADYAPLDPEYVDWSAYVNNGQLVPPVPTPPIAPQNEFTVNIPNASGSYTAVIIKRSGNGFVGPQGEFYPEFPSVAQLKIMYGK